MMICAAASEMPQQCRPDIPGSPGDDDPLHFDGRARKGSSSGMRQSYPPTACPNRLATGTAVRVPGGMTIEVPTVTEVLQR
jgi:hypothetical protein